MQKALQMMIDNMPEKTGKSLSEWKSLLAKINFAKHSEAMSFLKNEHGVSHGFSNTIIQLSKGNHETPEDLVSKQYVGKEVLKPIYDALLKGIFTLGDDITKTPKKDSISLIRKRQFALIKPAIKTRIDLGLKLKGKPVTERLGNSGPFGTMCTHRVQISEVSEVDSELMAWLKEAYEMSV